MANFSSEQIQITTINPLRNAQKPFSTTKRLNQEINQKPYETTTMNSTISVETQMRFHSSKDEQVLNSRPKKKKKKHRFFNKKRKMLTGYQDNLKPNEIYP